MRWDKYEHLSRDELERAINQWVICFRNADRNREILKRSLLDGRSYESIAEEFNLTPRQISNIIDKTEQKLFKHI